MKDSTTPYILGWPVVVPDIFATKNLSIKSA